jgi:tetratricopeptide (TPR) repeat protein
MLGAAERLTERAKALFDAGQYAGAIACCDELIEQFSGAEEREVRRSVFRAYSRKASALARLGRLDDTETAFDQLCVWLEGSSTRAPVPADRVDLLRALARKEAGQPERAVAIADDLLARLPGDPESVRSKLLLSTLMLKADALSDAGRQDEAAETYGALVKYAGDEEEPFTRRAVARALDRRGPGVRARREARVGPGCS